MPSSLCSASQPNRFASCISLIALHLAAVNMDFEADDLVRYSSRGEVLLIPADVRQSTQHVGRCRLSGWAALHRSCTELLIRRPRRRRGPAFDVRNCCAL